MANKILIGSTYYAEIQSKLGVDSTVLPNTDIDARSVLNIAENRIIESVPDYATLTNADSDYCYTAAICMVAAILAPSMAARIAKSKKDFDFTIENSAVDWVAREKELLQEAYQYVNLISTQTTTELPQFAVSGPTRANAPNTDPTPISGDTYLRNNYE